MSGFTWLAEFEVNWASTNVIVVSAFAVFSPNPHIRLKAMMKVAVNPISFFVSKT